jgi:hypothetical protein
VATSFTGSVTVALFSNPGDSTLGGMVTVPAVNGVVTFSGLTLGQAGTGYTLQATGGGLAAAATSAFDVGPAVVPTQLVLTTEQSGPVYGQEVTFTAAVTAADGGTPTGSVDFADTTTGQDLGTVSVQLVNGVAEATVSATGLTAGTHTIEASYTSANSSPFGNSSSTLSQTVTPAVLIVTANDARTVYGSALPSFTDTMTGFVNGDSASVVSGAASLTTTATASSGVGTYPITAAQGTLSAANYRFAFQSGMLRVTPATPTFSSLGVAGLTYGAVLSDSQLGGSATWTVAGSPVSVPGTFSFGSLAGTVLNAGSHPEPVTFDPTDGTDYTSASGTVTVVVSPATPAVSVNAVNLAYDTALANSQLHGTTTWTVGGQTVNVAGTFTYTSAAGSVLGAGNGQSEAVTFTPTDTTDYTTASTTVTVNVAQPLSLTALRGITARLVPVKVARTKRPRLMVEVFFADNGAMKREFLSPFQKPVFKDIQVSVRDGNGEGVPNEVVLTARKGRKTLTQIFSD